MMCVGWQPSQDCAPVSAVCSKRHKPLVRCVGGAGSSGGGKSTAFALVRCVGWSRFDWGDAYRSPLDTAAEAQPGFAGRAVVPGRCCPNKRRVRGAARRTGLLRPGGVWASLLVTPLAAMRVSTGCGPSSGVGCVRSGPGACQRLNRRPRWCASAGSLPGFVPVRCVPHTGSGTGARRMGRPPATGRRRSEGWE